MSPIGARATLFAELKTLFGVDRAGFETGFSVPKARALPLLQSYAVFQDNYSQGFEVTRMVFGMDIGRGMI